MEFVDARPSFEDGNRGVSQTQRFPILLWRCPDCVPDPFGNVPSRSFQHYKIGKGQIDSGKSPTQPGK